MKQNEIKSSNETVLQGYQVTSKLYESSNTLVYRAFHKQSKRKVILKVLKPEHTEPKELMRYEHEFEISRQLEKAGVIKSYELESYRDSLILLTEDIGGVSLK